MNLNKIEFEEIPQPENIEFYADDRFFVKQMNMPRIGTVIPQHSHFFDHVSMLALGAVRVWADGVLLGDFVAPKPITIKAGIKHTFLSLVPNSLIYCIHRLDNEGGVPIKEEHELPRR